MIVQILRRNVEKMKARGISRMDRVKWQVINSLAFKPSWQGLTDLCATPGSMTATASRETLPRFHRSFNPLGPRPCASGPRFKGERKGRVSLRSLELKELKALAQAQRHGEGKDGQGWSGGQ